MVNCDRTIDEPDHNIGAAVCTIPQRCQADQVNRRHTGVPVKNLLLE